ncbi:hypothetical protein [Methanobrevibacter sp.]|uniref:hypothetical protein n=1 Tax=Methanobrevibacter sp. TaxID=66852 RepID=UPI0038680D05
MDEEGTILIPIIGYIIAFIIPILGLIYGSILFFYKKDVVLYRKHGRYIIYFAIVIFIINLILIFTMGGFK